MVSTVIELAHVHRCLRQRCWIHLLQCGRPDRFCGLVWVRCIRRIPLEYVRHGEPFGPRRDKGRLCTTHGKMNHDHKIHRSLAREWSNLKTITAQSAPGGSSGRCPNQQARCCFSHVRTINIVRCLAISFRCRSSLFVTFNQFWNPLLPGNDRFCIVLWNSFVVTSVDSVRNCFDQWRTC